MGSGDIQPPVIGCLSVGSSIRMFNYLTKQEDHSCYSCPLISWIAAQAISFTLPPAVESFLHDFGLISPSVAGMVAPAELPQNCIPSTKKGAGANDVLLLWLRLSI